MKSLRRYDSHEDRNIYERFSSSQGKFVVLELSALGSTSGIGLAIAEKLVENGSHVIAVGRRKENLESFVSKHGKDRASSIQFDITDLSSIPSFVEACVPPSHQPHTIRNSQHPELLKNTPRWIRSLSTQASSAHSISPIPRASTSLS